jgi:DNA-directed RNA polymerase subunit H (RpoH/RPB5)
METSDIVDVLYRSRVTLLDHLEDMGYDTKKYRKFSPKEIEEMVNAGPPNAIAPALQMNLVRKEDSPVPGPENCLVLYTLGRIKQKLPKVIDDTINPEDGSFDINTTEVIIITLEPIAPNFHVAAASAWLNKNKKARIRFFQAACLINNPLKHILVPKHEKMLAEEEEGFLKENYAKKSQLPRIKFHEDPVARMIGLVPGDIVKITRPSATAGECIMYRVCVP